MEFIEGETLESFTFDDDENLDIVERVACAIEYLQQYHSDRPGPDGGGPAEGLPWADDPCECELNTRADLDHCLTKRIAGHNIDLSVLAMAHVDLAPRNIIVRRDRSIRILDWAMAGFYPPSFELASLQDRRHWAPKFFEALYSNLRQRRWSTTYDEEAKKVLKIQYKSLRHVFMFEQSHCTAPVPTDPSMQGKTIANCARLCATHLA